MPAAPAAPSSSPVVRMARRSARSTSTSVRPHIAATAISAGVSRVPRGSTTAPAGPSSARQAMLRRGASAACSHTTSSGAPAGRASGRVCSIGTTVAPLGQGAPVMMRTASPPFSVPAKAAPAATVPTTRTVPGSGASSAGSATA